MGTMNFDDNNCTAALEKAMEVCKKELCKEFKEWFSTQFAEVADTSESKP